MPLASGSSLGPYQIAAPLGSGGMGEVYRARDTRLNRDVAIKVLLPRLASSPVLVARFEREAQALAALSHPHIVAVYDVGHEGGTAYVVMECLEGQTLKSRLADGPLPVRKALEYGAQVAQALAFAHQRGIVHRDLKPENIFLTSDGPLKILDLGLAMLASTAEASVADTVPPGHEPPTAPGAFIGTPGYMSPEQARGSHIDARADIFSLGAVLYEMVSGHRAFEGDTVVDTLTAVMHRDPPPFGRGAQVPPELDRIIRRCLEKRPEERFQSARDLAFALEGVATGSSTSGMGVSPFSRVRLNPSWAVVATAAVLALAAGALAGRGCARAAPSEDRIGPVQFTIGANRGAVPEVSVAPTGEYLAWTAIEDGGQSGGVWVRRLSGRDPTLLADTPSSGTLFWSPDGREIVIATRDGRLVAIDVARGNRRILAELGANSTPLRGGDWAGTRLLVGAGNGIWLTDLSSREGRRMITSPKSGSEEWHGWPQFLPGGERFLFAVGLADGSIEARIGSLSDPTMVRVGLPRTITRAQYDPRGFLVYGNEGALFAQRVDIATGLLSGTPVRIAPEVLQYRRSGWSALSLSSNGVLAWRAPGLDHVQFEWVDRQGRSIGTVGEPEAYTNFDLSSDGTRVIATLRTADAGSSLYLLDTVRNVRTLVSDQPVSAPMSDPTWSPDARMIAYRRGTALVVRNAYGGEERNLTRFVAYPDSWSRDGRYLAVGRPQGTQYDLWAVALDGSGRDIPLVTGLALADEPRFSPNGRWVVFHAAVQGAPEVYAVPFPPTGERFQISSGGGVQPRWRADGRELYYLAPGGQMMAVRMDAEDPSHASAPEPLFNLRFEPSPAFDQFAPAPDGSRFIVRRPLRPGGADTAPVHVLVDWTRLITEAGK